MTISRTNNPSLMRRKGGRLAGSSTHGSLQNEPSLRALHASHEDSSEGLPDEYSSSMRPTRGRKIIEGKGTGDVPYWNTPLEYGPNYLHNLSHGHFASGGRAKGFSDPSHTEFHNNLLRNGGSASPKNLEAAAGMWVQKAFGAHPGALHRALKVPKGQKIPEAKLEKASHSNNLKMRKRANLALTAQGFNHRGNGRKG